ncbi:homoprotocatechuate degradation operon regulator HpaR [Defluviimonas sp. WL0002]|uniref:Homoprotocatechuate degradation operon regulator HpaR n=2 Tax=Albidovulum marisflavi TaxID=2984159 RepID=A0ABT2ZGP4_9RHOB|nr:homoprotocatechuate degradation operon regulator HpaR [Defluviimonas sp. WL0002]
MISETFGGNMKKHLPSTSRSLPFALIRAREGVMGPIRDMLAETGISEQQWRVLRILSECGPLDSSTLAERASLLHPSLTRMVFAMDKKGLVTQKRSDTDRRRQVITIAPAGQDIIDSNYEHALRIVRDFKAKLGEDRYEQLIDLLQMLDPHGDQ